MRTKDAQESLVNLNITKSFEDNAKTIMVAIHVNYKSTNY